MKKIFLFLLISLFLVNFTSAIEFEARTGIPNNRYDYTFNFTRNADCSDALLSYSDDITTDKNGNYFFDVITSSLEQIPYYLCEYKNEAIRKTHEFSDIIFRSILVRNITAERIDILEELDMNNGNITELRSIGFNISGCDGETHDAGYLCYDYDADTLSLTTQTGQVIQLSREISERGINRNGDLSDGSVVYMSGTSGDNPEFKAADGSNASESDFVGVLTVDCLSGEICPVAVFGFVNNLDTSMWNEKDKLYINASNPGTLTNIIPTLPNNPIWVATVIRSHANQGRIFVSPRIDPSDGFLINNIYATDSVQIMNNLSVGSQINITSGDLIVAGRSYFGVDPSEVNSVINPGDVGLRGNLIIEGGIAAIPNSYMFSGAFYNSGAGTGNATLFYTDFQGYLNTSEELFCDYTNNPFTASATATRKSILVIFSTELSTNNVFLSINRVINDSCVIVETDIFGDDDIPVLSTIAYALAPTPVFGILDNNLVINGIRMIYETNEALFNFGMYTWKNVLQYKPGGPLFNWAFTGTEGNIEYAAGMQSGLNGSIGFWRNSLGVFGTENYTIAEKQNLSLLHNAGWRWNKDGISPLLPYDSINFGADLAVQNGVETKDLVLHEAFIADVTTAEFDLSGNDLNVNNGSVSISRPVTFTQGFIAGEEVPIFTETFSTLGIFSNIQSDSGDWSSILDTVHCESGLCARGTGAGVGTVSMQTNFSTLDINETTLSFYYSLVNLIGLGELNAVVNNNEGSGDVEIFVDTTTDIIKEYEQISLPASMDNKTLITLTYTCDVASANKPTRQCFVDNAKVNGTSITASAITIPGFDSELCGGDGSRDINGNCNVGIRWDAETAQWIFAGTINASGTISGGISGTGTNGNVAMFIAPTVLGNSQITDNGTLVSVGLDFKVNDTFFVNAATERVGIGTSTPGAKTEIVDSQADTVTEVLRLTNYVTNTLDTKGGVKITSNFVSNRLGSVIELGQDSDYRTDLKSDSNIKFYTALDNSLSEAMIINRLGNVGIGTSGPQGELDVRGTSSNVGGGIYSRSGNSAIGLYDTSGNLDAVAVRDSSTDDVFIGDVDTNGGKLFLRANGSTKATILTDGNIGIGTTSPSEKLHVQGGNVVFRSDPGNEVRYLFEGMENNSADSLLKMWRGDSTSQIVLNTNGNSYLNGGNVGIGVVTAEEKLDVRDEAANDSINVIRMVNTDSPSAGELGQSVSITGNVWDSNANNDVSAGKITFGKDSDFTISANRDGNIQFHTRLDNVIEEKMRIDSSGNIGIGTDDPGAKVEIMGDALVSNDYLLMTDSNGNTAWKFSEDSGNNAVVEGGYNEDMIFKTLANADAEGFKFVNSSDDVRMIIQSGGNVGIGTNDPSDTLDVEIDQNARTGITVDNANGAGADSFAILTARSDNAVLNLLAHGTGRTITRYGVTVADYSELITSNSDGLLIGTGTQSLPIIFGNNNIERMRISAGGNIGIGTAGNPGARTEIVDDDTILLLTNPDNAGNSQALVLNNDYDKDIGMKFQNQGVDKWIIKNDAPTATPGYNSFVISDKDNNNVFQINQGGDVGIGTNDPSGKVDLVLSASGSKTGLLINQTASASGDTLLHIANNNAIGSGSYLIYSETDTAGEEFVHRGDGDVGIGTTSPSGKVEIAGTSQNELIINALAGSPDITFAEAGSNKGQVVYDISANGISFRVDDAGSVGSADEVMMLKNGGNIGIGTSSPGESLDVVGKIQMSNWTASGSDNVCWDGSGTSTIGDCSSLTEMKKNITNVTMTNNLWEKYMNLQPVTYFWNNENWEQNKQFGFLAENTAEVSNMFADYSEVISIVYEEVTNTIYENITEEVFDENLNQTINVTTQIATNVSELVEINRTKTTELRGINFDGITSANVLAIKSLKEENEMMKAYICSKDPSAGWC